jgi:hypothetical protein
MTGAAAEVVDEHHLGDLMAKTKALKLSRDVLMKEFDAADAAFKEAKVEVMEELRTQGTMMSKVEGVATASISKKVVPSTTDWTEFYAYMIANEMPELLQKRINQSAYTELRESGTVIPGVEDFEMSTLNFRVIT